MERVEVWLTLRESSCVAKMRYYFDDYGWLKCARRDRLYGSNGLCQQCDIIVRSRKPLGWAAGVAY